jgi:PhzF family phenazine biosynthesis protein
MLADAHRRPSNVRAPFYWIDAFTSRRFCGNPAGVVLSELPVPAELMQNIARENNLAETAFVVSQGEDFGIRWFTPTVEVELCGHATLASAYALQLAGRAPSSGIRFNSLSGPLSVSRDGDRLVLDFPARRAERIGVENLVSEALGVVPEEVYRAQAMMVVLASERALRELKPRMDLVAQLPGYGCVVTAPGEDSDFVSRFFAPQVGVPEDPVTGSTHCLLIPYWSQRLGKRALYARQISPRGGELWCEDRGERVHIGGHCALYFSGQLEL